MATRQVGKNKIKMAMFLKGKNNHNHCNSLQRRYFLEIPDCVNYFSERAEKILNKVLSRVNSVINVVSETLPRGFLISRRDTSAELALVLFTGFFKINPNLALKMIR